MSNLITCRKPPVNGGVCDKVLLIKNSLESLECIWSESKRSFVYYGGTSWVEISYKEMESEYDLFVWEPLL